MSEAGVEGYYTNHSLRATAVRLFQNDVDDKLIKGVTGHRSDALLHATFESFENCTRPKRERKHSKGKL